MTFEQFDSIRLNVDLVVGALDGRVNLFINDQSNSMVPSLLSGTYAQEGGSTLYVPSVRSAPHVADLDGDGKKDLLAGNTSGELLFYSNVGTDAAPSFLGYSYVESDGIKIDLPYSPRSRQFVCDWNNDGQLDVLVGSGDGQVRLYQGVPEPATLSILVAGVILLRRKKR